MTSKPEPVIRHVRSRDGLELAVHDYGGSGEVLLLCHCTGCMGRIWDPVASRLRDTFHVLAPDARGHGDSDRPEERGGCSWVRMGQDLIDIIRDLHLPLPLKAAGHSAGGAQIAMAEWLQHGTFSRTVLMDAIIGGPEFFEGANLLASRARRRRSCFESAEEARANFTGKAPMNTWTDETMDALLAHGFRRDNGGRLYLKCEPGVESWMYEMGSEHGLFEHLSELGMASLIVTGEKSDTSLLAESQHARMGKSEFRVLEKRSHFMPQEDPDGVAALILEWLGPDQI